jgi:hypothetical protein
MDMGKKGIRIRLEPRDEYMHPLEEAVNFNESMYSNIFMPSKKPFGGWFRVGNRANERYAEMSCCLYLPDGRVGFMYKKPEISDNKALDAGGMKFEVIEPFKHLKVTYKGKLCLMKNPHDMANPKKAFSENPMTQCEVDIDYTGASPMYGGEPVNEDGSPIQEKAEEAFARGHYEQHLTGKGKFRIEDETFDIVDGYGLRDHSWGPRFWQNIYWYRWLPMNFSKEFAMMVSIITMANGVQRIGGMVLRNNEYLNITEASVKSQYDENDYQTEFKIWAKTEEREYNIEAKALSLIPLRNRRQNPDGEWLNTRITEAMTEYKCDGLVGYGMSEFLDQIVDGKAVGKAFS